MIILHLTALKVIFATVNAIGVVVIWLNLQQVRKNRAAIFAAGLNGELQIEASASIWDERIRLIAVLLGLAIGIYSFFVLDRPAPDHASQVFSLLAAISITYISASAVLNSFRQLRKIARMLAYRGVDLKHPPDYYRE